MTRMLRCVFSRSRVNRETGAVLPIVAILIVVLLVFAAFTVDLGAAWAARRQLQSAADAGAMAGALPPLAVGDNIATTAMDFVDTNVGTPVDRLGCTGWTPTDEGVSGSFSLVDSVTTNCVWISGATADGGRLLAVKVPDQQIPTAFARVIGVDSLAVDAFAVSKTALGNTNVLPFALVPAVGPQECLGSPPAGIAQDPCSGASSGNFGYLTSPFWGTDSSPGTCPPGGANDSDVLIMNLVLGTDHPLAVDLKWPADNAGADSDLPDECVAFDLPPYPAPDSVMTFTGNRETELHAGLVSNDPGVAGIGGLEGRLQQGSPSPPFPDAVDDTRTIGGKKNNEDMDVDNIGLWQYVLPGGTNSCARPGDIPTDPAAPWNTGGPLATAQMDDCIAQAHAGTSTVTFDSSLWEDSPRFAVVPQLWNTFPSGGSAPRAIEQFRGVYLQTSWFNCSAASGSTKPNQKDACLVFPSIDPNDPAAMIEQEVFRPGEGDDTHGVACDPLGAAGNKCKAPGMGGISSYVLPIGSIPSDILNGTAVRYLYR
jgi:hypothetical protein